MPNYIDTLSPQMKKAIELKMDGADIMHGHLKTLMVEAEKHLEMCLEREEETEEAMDSMDRTYAEGYLDALTVLYGLTYEIAFAKAEGNK